MKIIHSRRSFIRHSGNLIGGTLLGSALFDNPAFANSYLKKVKLSAHIWVYASKFPPNWDCTPVLGKAFADLKFAGLDGVELMEINLRHDDAVSRISSLMKKHKFR